MDIIDIIQKNSLTVRCLPYEVVTMWTYREGDEDKKYVDSNGKPIEAKREVVTELLDLEYFKNNKSKYNTLSPEKRLEEYKKKFPNGRKLLKETKQVKNGGWWYVKESKHTDSTIMFSNVKDTFTAPTLEEAIKLYLDSKKHDS